MSAFSQKFQNRFPPFYSRNFLSFESGGSNVSSSTQNKPRTKPTGWEDEDDEPQFKLTSGNSESKPNSSNPINPPVQPPPANHKYGIPVAKVENLSENNSGITLSQRINFSSDFELLTGEELTSKNIEYEMKLVEDIIQPQGAKIRPPEDVLQEFGKACESLQVQIIGSLILASFSCEINWKSLIKCLYVIEFLCKKIPTYARYFKYHRRIIEDLNFQGDQNQVKQIKAAHDSLLEKLKDQPTPKNNSTRGGIDPMVQKFKAQENQNLLINNPNNLLEDSDQEHKPPTKPQPSKLASSFSFIKEKENPAKALIQTNLNPLKQMNAIPHTQTDPLPKPQSQLPGFNLGLSQNKNTLPGIDPQLAAIDFSAPMKEIPKQTTPSYNLGVSMPVSQPVTQNKPHVQSNNPNYSILDSIHQPIQQPFFTGGYSSVQPPIQSRPFTYQTNPQFSTPSIPARKAEKESRNEKESAFDFVNDLVKLK